MEDQVERLVSKVWDKFQDLPQSKRYMVAVSGIPGSGTHKQTATEVRMRPILIAS